MKKIIMLLCLGLSAFGFTLSAQTADEIISKFEMVSGGRAKLESITSLKVESTMKMVIMRQNLDISLSSIREKGKLYRREMSGIMGMGKSFVLVTDTAGYVYTPTAAAARNWNGGGPGGVAEMPGNNTALVKMTPEELSAQKFELDCAGPFAALVNYAAKGSKAELLGTGKVNKQECYKVKLTLSNGQSATYYISNKDFSVLQIDAAGEMAANLTGFSSLMKMMGSDRARNLKASITYSDYKQFGGIFYPTKQVISVGPVETIIENTDIKVNDPVDPVWYSVNTK